jgi:hypothetical protein
MQGAVLSITMLQITKWLKTIRLHTEIITTFDRIARDITGVVVELVIRDERSYA